MDINALLLNFLFILLPLFLTNIIFSLKPSLDKMYKEGIMVLTSSFSIMMCMNYTIELAEGFYYDLRLLPFTLIVLYAGYRAGFFVLVLSLFYRFYIGGDGFFVSVVLFITIFLVSGMVKYKFDRSSLRGRLIIPAVIITLFQLALLCNYIFNLNQVFILSFVEWFSLIVVNILGILFITYIIELLRKINQMQTELVKIEKLRVVSSLAASISHEIKNPLTVTRGFIQMIKDNNLSLEKQAFYLNMAIQEIDHANSILSDYLMFSKTQVQKNERIDVTKELSKVVRLIHPLANMKKIEVETVIANTGVIMGDKVKLHQCLLNLMKNGIEAMEKGGTLKIETCMKQNDYYIHIKDNGAGIAPEEISRIGTPYYSTKENGTGLGMMVVFNIVKSMSGNIEVKSKLGKGTNIALKFPCVKEN